MERQLPTLRDQQAFQQIQSQIKELKDKFDQDRVDLISSHFPVVI